MTFTLEALEAQHGDALLLHYGTADSPRLAVIDGGPKGTFAKTVKKRLAELRGNRTAPLSIDLLMVSHIDEDHISGVIDLLREMKDAKDDDKSAPYSVDKFWINTFADKLGNAGAASLDEWHAAGKLPSGFMRAFEVSVTQGRTLRDLAKGLNITPNEPFVKLVEAPAKGAKTVKLPGGLTLTIVAPNAARLGMLKSDWKKHLPKGRAKKASAAELAVAAAYVDKTVYNLSSIVVLAAVGAKRMLLTGDARGDDVIAGLDSAGLLKKGVIDIDVLKLPHHGSDRNVATDFFRTIRADNYVISANGKFGNPDTATLEMLSEARPGEKFTIWLTNRDGESGLKKRLERFFTSDKRRKYTVKYRDEKALSLSVTP
ncbi:MAG: metallo-beta-lactamase family protein [Labilithrix sp.]|nr:metallo-beta-lactamase family protein [Labilithrix sp.]